ncbi:MAG: hypothetical protein H6765_00175 [Candidatus Peribacteria bacterium]|nr:MAG: hypothetical protein H6765_00175 [Candidatus Peribacteria bacterium]
MRYPEECDDNTEGKNKRKLKHADKNHELYGVAQFRKALKYLSTVGITTGESNQSETYVFDPERIAKVEDYIANHDYLTPKMNGDRFHEPVSLEGKIARLADRISESNPAAEVQRYRDTGKRLQTAFFKPSISAAERDAFSFGKIGEYAKQGKLDQFMFFEAIFAVTPEDFSHPVLQDIYRTYGYTKTD